MRVADQPLHRGEFVGRGLGAFRGRLAHHIATDSRMTDQRAHIAAAPLAERVHVLGDRLPGEVDALAHHAHRDGLGFREELEIPVMVAGPRRRDHLAALADQDRGVAVLHRGTAIRIPQRLRIEMRVVIDESRSDDPPVGVDGALGARRCICRRRQFFLDAPPRPPGMTARRSRPRHAHS